MKHPQAPEIFQKPIASLDLPGLPSRESPGFRDAVITHYALSYASKGWNAAVTIDDEFVRVVAIPERGMDPKRYVLGLLQNGFLQDALPILEALFGMLADADIAYNYGICLSELGDVAEAVHALKRCLEIDPTYTHALVGLGVAYTRLGQDAEAESALRKAIEQDPQNAYAKRNLAAVLARSGKLQDALPYFRQAASLTPNDPAIRLGLAQCLDRLEGDYRKEADKVYAEIMRRFPDHPAAETAKLGRNRIASEQLHAPVDGKLRMDAVFYIQSALETFSSRSRQQIGEIVMEIARLGEQGLKIHDPAVRYNLATLPGDYSGLQLMSMMHAGVRTLDPKADPGTGLDREYEMALSMSGSK